MFLGTYSPRLDDKGRLFLPAKFRDELAEGLVALYPKLAKDVELRSAAISALLARPSWNAALVRGVDGELML